jgi:hypothetical protein
MLPCAALKASDDIRLRSAEQRFKVSDGQRAQLFGVLGQHPMQLVQAAGAKLRVGRPAGVVEGAARRAAATAAWASATDASGAWPITCPVAGLTDGYVRSAAVHRTCRGGRPSPHPASTARSRCPRDDRAY